MWRLYLFKSSGIISKIKGILGHLGKIFALYFQTVSENSLVSLLQTILFRFYVLKLRICKKPRSLIFRLLFEIKKINQLEGPDDISRRQGKLYFSDSLNPKFTNLSIQFSFPRFYPREPQMDVYHIDTIQYNPRVIISSSCSTRYVIHDEK